MRLTSLLCCPPSASSCASALVWGLETLARHACGARREFKRAEDMYAQDSIHLLEVSGIDFAQMEARGIEVHRFGEVLMSSGIVLNDEVTPLPHALWAGPARTLGRAEGQDGAIAPCWRTCCMGPQGVPGCQGGLPPPGSGRCPGAPGTRPTAPWLHRPRRPDRPGAWRRAQIQWITFHSGYDFGYLLKILTCQPLPATDAEFFEILQVRSPPMPGGPRTPCGLRAPALPAQARAPRERAPLAAFQAGGVHVTPVGSGSFPTRLRCVRASIPRPPGLRARQPRSALSSIALTCWRRRVDQDLSMSSDQP